MEKRAQGLVIVHTGSGKGKTTAAMGMALRAAGHGLKTLMIQFIKGSWKYGELESIKKLAPFFKIKPMGKGFIRFDKNGPGPEDLQAVKEAWAYFKQEMTSGSHDIIVLDEINYAVDYQLISIEEVLEAIRSKPDELHLILTGRNALPELVKEADLVTEMLEIKHPFQKGIKAQKGIEF